MMGLPRRVGQANDVWQHFLKKCFRDKELCGQMSLRNFRLNQRLQIGGLQARSSQESCFLPLILDVKFHIKTWITGEWPRWQSRKTLSSPPLTSTPKSQLSAEQPLMKKTGTYQKRSSTTKDIKKEPQQDKQEGGTLDVVKSHTSWVGNPQTGEKLCCRDSSTGVNV